MHPQTSAAQANKPTRPRTAYNLFLHDFQHRIREELNRKISYTEMSKLVAARWRKIDPQEKAHYDKLAIRDKRRFALEMVQWKIQEESKSLSKVPPVENFASDQGAQNVPQVQEQKHQFKEANEPVVPMVSYSNRSCQEKNTSHHKTVTDFVSNTSNAEQTLHAMMGVVQAVVSKHSNGQAPTPGSDQVVMSQHLSATHNARHDARNSGSCMMRLPVRRNSGLNGFNLEDVPLLEELFGIQTV